MAYNIQQQINNLLKISNLHERYRSYQIIWLYIMAFLPPSHVNFIFMGYLLIRKLGRHLQIFSQLQHVAK